MTTHLEDELSYMQDVFLSVPDEMWELSDLMNLLPCFLDGKLRSLTLLHKLQDEIMKRTDGLKKIDLPYLGRFMKVTSSRYSFWHDVESNRNAMIQTVQSLFEEVKQEVDLNHAGLIPSNRKPLAKCIKIDKLREFNRALIELDYAPELQNEILEWFVAKIEQFPRNATPQETMNYRHFSVLFDIAVIKQ